MGAQATAAAATTVAASCRRCSSSKFSRACGALTIFAACGAREAAHHRCPTCSPKAIFFTFPSAVVRVRGSSGSKNFLLHESIDLNELYPTVPSAPKVYSRLIFGATVSEVARLGFVHQYARTPPCYKGNDA